MDKKDLKNHNHPQGRSAIVTKQHVYSSPLPPPDILEQYERIQPGLIQKVIAMTEVQASHRRELENKNLEAGVKHLERQDK